MSKVDEILIASLQKQKSTLKLLGFDIESPTQYDVDPLFQFIPMESYKEQIEYISDIIELPTSREADIENGGELTAKELQIF